MQTAFFAAISGVFERVERPVVEFFTGAGISADSGIATFRDKDTGLWSQVDPQEVCSMSAWARDPELVFGWHLWQARLMSQAAPNPGHFAAAAWEGSSLCDAHVTTQNIDSLHEAAGSRGVAHLHGNVAKFECSICGRPYRGEVPLPEEPVERIAPPECPACGNLVKPAVTFFGEALPARDWKVAEERMLAANLVIIIGTSGVVFPAAGLPVEAKRAGATLVEISPQPTDLTPLCSATWSTTAAEAGPALQEFISAPY